MQLLKIYTRHGKEYEVPKITEQSLQDVMSSQEMSLFDIVVIDSIYREDIQAGTILTQDPNPEVWLSEEERFMLLLLHFLARLLKCLFVLMYL